MLDTILSKCDERYEKPECGECMDCTYKEYCPGDCEVCLDYIHNPSHSPVNAPERKYDCVHMADVYACKYSCRYTSEIIYALKRCKDLRNVDELKVLSFGCGPCTDLFAIDYLHSQDELKYGELEYRGVDYSRDVWKNIHRDIKQFENSERKIRFFYQDACELITLIERGNWVPNLIVFQYVFSDMQKHTDEKDIKYFMDTFARYFNEKVSSNTYIILNDINLGRDYGGGREYFDQLLRKLRDSISRKGRFCNDNSRSEYYPRGYTYGENSDGEFPQNENFFDIRKWKKYSPFDTCASAQMIIKKEVI